MKLYTFGAIGIAMLMFICVLFGMQQAKNGIHKMKGYEDVGFESSLSIEQKNGNIQASILGEDITSHDLQQKKQQLESAGAFNLLSSVGKGVADTVSSLVEKGVSIIGDTIEEKRK